MWVKPKQAFTRIFKKSVVCFHYEGFNETNRWQNARAGVQAEAELIRKGEFVAGSGFDSNCITPGTAFMARLNDHLRYFIRKKIAEDPLWQKPTIILSGRRPFHNVNTESFKVQR